MARERRNNAAAALAVAAAFAAAAAAAGAPAAPGNSNAPGTPSQPAAFTLSTPMLRTAAEWFDPAAADWTGRLPEMRLRMDSGQGFNLRDPGSSLGGLGVRGFEIAVPSAPYLWLGVEASDDDSGARRATLSIQKSF